MVLLLLSFIFMIKYQASFEFLRTGPLSRMCSCERGRQVGIQSYIVHYPDSRVLGRGHHIPH